MLNSTVKSVSSNGDNQVELQVTHDESESHNQGGEDQHGTTESSNHQSTSFEAYRASIALDRVRRVGVGTPRRYMVSRIWLPMH